MTTAVFVLPSLLRRRRRRRHTLLHLSQTPIMLIKRNVCAREL